MATKKAAGRKTTKKSARKASPSKTSASKKTAAKKGAAKKASAKKTAKSKSSAKTFKPGDKVAWDTSQGETRGKVVKKQTTPTMIKTHKVAASKDNPQYIVETDKSHKRAAHKPQELRKKG